MSGTKPFYITTTLPYVNAPPHIGFALEIVKADIQARYHSLLEEEVFFNTGTDEHGLKIYRNAIAAGKDPQEYVDEYAKKFKALTEKLNLFPGLHFIRTTDPHHKAAAQEFWRRCQAAGDIYKKEYQIKYCVGCELEKTDSELTSGHCPLHPKAQIEIINEENYFFRFSKYQQRLLDLYAKHPNFVLPDFRLNEITLFVKRSLQDFSISRLKEKMPWGIPVPDDPEQIMYVWFDALVNYISVLGWPEDRANFEKFWGTLKQPNALQIGGKDNLRQQSAMWQAMLMSAGLPTSKQVVIQGFVITSGQKMSKSLGNVVDPFEVIDEYGTDAVRYYLARRMSAFEDSDFTMEKFKETYNADLANGLGNLVARIMQLAQTHLSEPVKPQWSPYPKEFTELFEKFELNRALDFVFARVQALDQKITQTEPFKLVKADAEKGKKLIAELVLELAAIDLLLEPFLPQTSQKIIDAIMANKKPQNLFPRLS